MNKSAEFLVLQRVRVNKCLRELASQHIEKRAQWGALAGRAATTVGRYAVKHPVKSLFGGMMAYQGLGDAKNTVNDWRSLNSNVGGNRFIDANGHYKSTGAKVWNTIGTIGDWAWLVPGVGWIASLGIGLGARAIGSAIQNRADKQWAQSQASLQRAGLGANPYGAYGNRPRAVK